MASAREVKQYLAHWFQLGRRVFVRNGDVTPLPSKIFAETGYSKEFERCWETVIAPASGDCYLEDTDTTISQLLSSEWDVIDCARCKMPVPMPVLGMAPETCPCVNMAKWPDLELPMPRSAPVGQLKLQHIRDRLQQLSLDSLG
jgi:hypothetical protein